MEETTNNGLIILFVLKLIKLILQMICVGIHLEGFFITEDVTAAHCYYLMVFVFFSTTTMLSMLDLCRAEPWPMWFEIILNLLGYIFFCSVCVVLMVQSEQGYEMISFEESESPFDSRVHQYYVYAKRQSILSLFTGTIYFMQLLFVIDAMTWRPSEDEYYTGIEHEPIQLYFLSKNVHQWCANKFDWFSRFGIETDI